MVANNFNVATGVTNAKPNQLLEGDAMRGGIWWDAATWDTKSWALRQLAAGSQLNMGVDATYYLTFKMTYRSDDSLGFGFSAGEADTSRFLSVGVNWNTTSFNGNLSAKRLVATYGTLNVDQGVSGANAWSTNSQVANNVNYDVLVKITAKASGEDLIQAAFFATSRTGYGLIPAAEANVTWDLTHNFVDNNTYTHLLAFINGGTRYANLDAFRMGTAYSDVVQIQPLITAQPVPSPAASIYAGVTLTMSVTATGGLPEAYTYQWYKGPAAIPGATSATFSNAAPVVNDSGDYWVQVRNSHGSANSITNTISILPANPPVVTADVQPLIATRYLGGNVRFTAAVDGTPPFRFQWKLNGAPVPNGTNVTLTISDLSQAHSGTYQLFVTNAHGWTSTAQADLSLKATEPGSYEALLMSYKPKSYWRLDEQEFTQPTDIGFDYAGGNDLFHTNVMDYPGPQSPAFPGMNPTNNAASYDGYSTASATAGSIMNNLQQFTLMGWFKPSIWPQTTLAGSGRVALFGQNDCAEFGFHGTNIVGMWTPGGGYVSFNAATLISADNWYFITAVGTGTNVTFYLNGNLAAAQQGVTTNYGSSSFPFRVGYGVLDSGANEFTGQIDEVALFDRALSEAEINALYAKAAGSVAPSVLTQPAGAIRYATRTNTLSVIASGTLPLRYQWRKNGANILNATNATLVLPNLNASDNGRYDVVISNNAGSTTSAGADLRVVTPVAGSYESIVTGLNPVAYWRLNENAGETTANEYWNGLSGTYNAAAMPGQPGPRPPAFSTFESTNNAVQTVAATADSWVTLPGMSINTNSVTLSGWFYSDTPQSGFTGLIFNRNSPTVAGLHFGNANELRYTWNDQNWDWNSGLVAPLGVWTFATLVVEANKATIYMGSNGQLQSAVNTTTHPNQSFSGTTFIAHDPNNVNRTFNGLVDEVTVFDRALSPADVQQLFASGSGAVRVAARLEGSNLVLTWAQGTLQVSDSPAGPFSDLTSATSPYIAPATGGSKFYRIKVQ